MAGSVDRRGILKGVAAGVAAAAVPVRVFAQPFSITEQHRRILAVAAEQVQRVQNVLWRTDIVGVADFALPSSLPRLHFANLERGEVRSFLVAHGKGSDPEHDGFLKLFSNEINSLATSRGAFITYEWYRGKYGTSIRLGGIDPDNNHALDRAIVMHPAWYANPVMLEKWGKLGRSDGCFAMAEADFNEALWHLSGGRLLYADRLAIY
ncbi:murein L,D-transpeptidase catalytic domain-containing protein [Novosphingobium cyanobacteriorum]|uniref:Murein L,D-transpeptidase catalytic domain family protein n=1 Tax=Novosphingobium cyanobacteriorum TaxID=3024215 RepID=A0ABT6CHY0_9SPHN|nr:murein L,D-transpeptidase catalytic domain family protein [Novosphingobium cyanobacteriorum]MDF8333535.1 murein L,D-transpeptidase catalytic domain family protein [Novosphingobium cyanobacteriorum]